MLWLPRRCEVWNGTTFLHICFITGFDDTNPAFMQDNTNHVRRGVTVLELPLSTP
jgi:hypothetical protein